MWTVWWLGRSGWPPPARSPRSTTPWSRRRWSRSVSMGTPRARSSWHGGSGSRWPRPEYTWRPSYHSYEAANGHGDAVHAEADQQHQRHPEPVLRDLVVRRNRPAQVDPLAHADRDRRAEPSDRRDHRPHPRTGQDRGGQAGHDEHDREHECRLAPSDRTGRHVRGDIVHVRRAAPADGQIEAGPRLPETTIAVDDPEGDERQADTERHHGEADRSQQALRELHRISIRRDRRSTTDTRLSLGAAPIDVGRSRCVTA